MKKVSVVILNWNGRKLLERYLPSVVQHTPSETAEIVVADNGSTDDSVAYLEREFPSVRVILLKRNYGFAEGYNRALEGVDAEYAVLLNSDVEVTPGWLDVPLAELEAHADIAAVQPKLLSDRNRSEFEYAGASGGFIDKYGYPFCRGRVFDVVESDRGQYDAVRDIFWGSGACLVIRKSVYEEAGGLDTGFFAHQEEIDLCWRLRSRGYRIVCTPASVVYHLGGGTLNAESPRKTHLNFRNNLLMLYKNLPEKELGRVFRIRFFFDYLAAFVFLLKKQPHNARAVYEARKDFFRLKRAYEPARTENLKKQTLAAIPEMSRRCLLYEYHIKKNRTFASLVGE